MTNPTDYAPAIAAQLNVRPAQVAATIALFDEGNTVPFIARYRKERTDGLDEEQIRQTGALLDKLRALDERRAAVLASVEEQGKLSPELRAQFAAATTLTALEDLYQPYKQKRRTRASMARERGLQPLADLVVQQARPTQPLDQLAAPLLSPDVPSADDAWAGARDIVAEAISDHADVRRRTREKALQWAVLRSDKIAKAEDGRGVFQNYYEFETLVSRLRPHQVLAINRGEAEHVLRVRLVVPERDWRDAVASTFRPDRRSPLAEQLALAIDDAAERLLLPAIERDVRASLAEHAETHAIDVFAANMRALLSQPPLADQMVLGLDPGFRTGCKAAVVDATGRVLDTATIFPHEPQRQHDAALRTLRELVARHGVTLIAIGNGTASRETEQLAADLIKLLATENTENKKSGKHTASENSVPSVAQIHLAYIIVNEAGASVYSASPLARAELPGMDVSMRGAVSIARRVQDPLAELVKIDPQSIGVGMYQHDVNQPRLSASLGAVVESVVNRVGVDVNTASPALLTYVAGIGPKLAAQVVAHRDASGAFTSRAALRKVKGLGPKAFEQSAGFLRVRGGDNPLDASAIHPESYTVAQAVLQRASLSPRTPPAERQPALAALQASQPLDALAAELGTGTPTLADILEQLVRPGRDPRADLPAPILRSDVLSLSDLAPGMRLNGTVRNVVDFGAFVDIGVKQDGLLHRSQMPRGTLLHVGDIIEVEVQQIEAVRGRIALAWAGEKS